MFVKSLSLKVDEEKTTKKSGFINVTTVEVRHSDLTRVDVSQGVFQKIFNLGQVCIYTTGDQPEILVNGIEEFIEIKNTLNKLRSNKDIRNQENKSNSEIDTIDKIKKLNELKDQGILNQEEFDKKKNELMEKI